MRGILLAGVLALAACSTVTFTPYEIERPAKPVAPCSARVLERAPAEARYVELGFCAVEFFPRVRVFGGTASLPGRAAMEYTPRAIEELRKCACEHGGNAIVIRADESEFHPMDSESVPRVKPHGTVLFLYPDTL